MFDILYQDEDLIIINKPSGILVHRTSISEDRVFVLQLLRDQIGQHLYPVHRLDRPTSGVLVFAKNKETAQFLGQQFMDAKVSKTYLAVIRGFIPEEALIDYPLLKKNGQAQAAQTYYKRLAQVEMPWVVNRYPTSRYSLVEVQPKTGKWHQIRRHFSHLRHPIIGDHRHGDNKHNNYFREVLGVGRMLLHAQQLSLQQRSGEILNVSAPLGTDFLKGMKILGFQPS